MQWPEKLNLTQFLACSTHCSFSHLLDRVNVCNC